MADNNSDPIKKPPRFSEQLRYETFKTKSMAWQRVTSFKKELHRLVLALNLATSEANSIGERIFQELSIPDLEGEIGSEHFWTYMDKQFQKDSMVQMCIIIKDFTLL